jgi:hypothetical protein
MHHGEHPAAQDRNHLAAQFRLGVTIFVADNNLEIVGGESYAVSDVYQLGHEQFLRFDELNIASYMLAVNWLFFAGSLATVQHDRASA